MDYLRFAELYHALSQTTKRIEKAQILVPFLQELHKSGRPEWIYLLRGKVLPDYDPGEFGISTQIAIKVVCVSFGVTSAQVVQKLNTVGDIGEVAETFAQKKQQSVLFSTKLSVRKVFGNLSKVISIEGNGAIDRKLALLAELFTSASPLEAKYLVRTVLSDLRVGVADAILLDALAEAFFADDPSMRMKLEEAYDLANDFALLFDAAVEGKSAIDHIALVPGRPVKAMLAVKADSFAEAFRICGTPVAVEYKYDGFRMHIHKKGEKVFLFTRKLENVTSQFPDVVQAIRKHVRGDSFILDCEVVGFNPQTKKYTPFEAISQRIKRKYDINKLVHDLPVEINVFDVLFFQDKSVLDLPFVERRKIVDKIIRSEPWKIRVSSQIITENEHDAEAFYKKALEVGEEGVMIKKIDAPYKQGRRVGYMVKLKPSAADFDLVIVGAEYGTGKRGGLLTSYIVACRSGDQFLEVGKVSSGLKEKEEEGMSYDEMTALLKPLIIEEKGNEVVVTPKVVVSVTYQNIQRSPSYTSGYALRFPRITIYRPDKGIDEIADLADLEEKA